MLQTIPGKLESWESAVDLHLHNAIHCIKTGNFSYVHASLAVSSTMQLSQNTAAAPVDPAIAKVIQDIEEADAYSKEENFKEFTDKVEALKTKTPDKEAWELEIDTQTDVLIQKASDGIRASTALIKEQIRQLPEDKRQPAASLFVSASNIVLQVVQQLIEQAKVVLQKIVDFLKGIWAGIKAAYEVVKGAVSSAVNAIKGLFGFSGSSLAPPPVTQFVGRLNWPASVGIIVVSGALSYLTTQLVKKGYTYDKISIDYTKDGKTIATSTRFGPSEFGSPGLQYPDLAVVWKNVVDDLGNDLHYIPPEGADVI